jgi:DNA-binding beta-propeller fold protein YncE
LCDFSSQEVLISIYRIALVALELLWMYVFFTACASSGTGAITAPTSAPTLAAPIVTPTSQPTASPPELVVTMKGDPNPFLTPSNLALDPQGNLYVLDAGYARIQKFDRNGQFSTNWGSPGDGDGQFHFFEGRFGGVAVDGQGNVFVADVNNARLQKFDSSGKFLAKWGSKGKDDGQFLEPIGVAVDSLGDVYVMDQNSTNPRVQKFSGDGKFLAKWGSFGSGNGQFLDIDGIGVDGRGNVYVADAGNERVQEFDANGKFLLAWNKCSDEHPQMTPISLAFDSQGNVYVTDFDNSRVCKFDNNGRFLTAWGSRGKGDGQFSQPVGIAVDALDNVYVADPFNNRIEKFRQP